MTLPSLTETLGIRALLGDGDPVEALLAVGRTPPPGAPGTWSAAHPDSLTQAFEAFAEAGADCLTAPPAADPASVTDLEGAARATTATVQLARQAAGLGRYVLAVLSGGFAPADAAHLAAAALQGEADALLLDDPASAADPAALITAVRAAAPVPVIARFAFGRPASAGRSSGVVTVSGFSAEACAGRLSDWAPDAVALAAAPGALPEDLTGVVAAFRARTDLPLLVWLPAGPVEPETGQVTRPDPPEILAEQAWPLIRSGANLLAGGPGMTPAHLQLLREELDRL